MLAKIKELIRSGWPIMQTPKTGMQEKQLLQDPGYVGGVEGPCCMLHGILQGCTNIMLKVLKEIK